MGVAQSSPYLSDDITLNRIRSVCQSGDKTMATLKRPNIELLANDLATLGYPIKLKDSNGNPYSSEHLCNLIRMTTVPSVERVCMMSGDSGSRLDQLIDQTVNHFRKNYGAEISVNETYRGKSRRRSNDKICDDLYYVSDKLARKLSDRPRYVKAQLEEGIQKLEKQKRMLDDEFRGAILDLNQSKQQDNLEQKVSNIKRIHELATYETEKELDKSINQLNSIINNLNDEQLEGVKNQIITLTQTMGPTSGTDLKGQVQGLLDIMSQLPALNYGLNKGVIDFYEGDLFDNENNKKYAELMGDEKLNEARYKSMRGHKLSKDNSKTGTLDVKDAASLIAEHASKSNQMGGMSPDVGYLEINNELSNNFSYF